MSAIIFAIAVAVASAIVMSFWWLVWAVYMAVAVDLGAPPLSYWQMAGCLFLLSVVGRLLFTRGAQNQ